jgi:hypothetical protein
MLLVALYMKCLNRYLRNRNRAEIAPKGIEEIKGNTVIPFEKINTIVGRREWINVIIDNASIKMYILKREMIKLTTGGMLKWVINGGSFNILPEQNLSVRYSPIGKYAISFYSFLKALMIFLFLNRYN